MRPDLPDDWFAKHDIHIHVPAGAVPKDGPSAGVAMATALASLVSGKPVRNDVAMTGEITLTGQVLPIGGVKEKALAAQRAGIKQVIVPDRNEGDVEEIPEHEREGSSSSTSSEIGDGALGRGSRQAEARRPRGLATRLTRSSGYILRTAPWKRIEETNGGTKQKREGPVTPPGRSPRTRTCGGCSRTRSSATTSASPSRRPSNAYGRMSNGKGPAKA